MRRRFLGYLGCNEGERDVGMQLHLKLAEEPGVLVAVGYTAQSNCNAINDIQDTSTHSVAPPPPFIPALLTDIHGVGFDFLIPELQTTLVQ